MDIHRHGHPEPWISLAMDMDMGINMNIFERNFLYIKYRKCSYIGIRDFKPQIILSDIGLSISEVPTYGCEKG
jgi:hypothetical protein